MSPIEGGRHYQGPGDPAHPRAPWTCPSCGTPQQTPLEGGCLSCGAGTPEANARAAEAVKARGVKNEELRPLLVGAADFHTALLVGVLEIKARVTIARALAFYAEQGSPAAEELTRAQMLAWGRRIAEAVEVQESMTKETR